jgi:hypothetical protein
MILCMEVADFENCLCCLSHQRLAPRRAQTVGGVRAGRPQALEAHPQDEVFEEEILDDSDMFDEEVGRTARSPVALLSLTRFVQLCSDRGASFPTKRTSRKKTTTTAATTAMPTAMLTAKPTARKASTRGKALLRLAQTSARPMQQARRRGRRLELPTATLLPAAPPAARRRGSLCVGQMPSRRQAGIRGVRGLRVQ